MNTYSSLLLRVMIAGLATQYVVGGEAIQIKDTHPNREIGSIVIYSQWHEAKTLKLYPNQHHFDIQKASLEVKLKKSITDLAYCVYNDTTFIRTLRKTPTDLIFNFYNENLQKLPYKLTLSDTNFIASDCASLYYSKYSDDKKSHIFKEIISYDSNTKQLSATEVATSVAINGKFKKAVINNGTLYYFFNNSFSLYCGHFNDTQTFEIISCIDLTSHSDKKKFYIEDFEVPNNNTIKITLTNYKKSTMNLLIAPPPSKKYIIAHYDETNNSWITYETNKHGKIKKAIIKNDIIYFANGSNLLHLHYASCTSSGEISSISSNSFINFELYSSEINPLYIDSFKVINNNTIKVVLTNEKKSIKKIIMAHYNEENNSWTTHEITEQH